MIQGCRDWVNAAIVWEACSATGPDRTPEGSIVSGASVSVGLRAGPDRQTLRLWIITDGALATMLKRAVHPGDVLRYELEARGVSPASFARQIDVPANRISQILAGKRAVTGDSALRFGHWFGMDPQFWLYLQTQYELAVAERSVEQRYVPCPLRPAASRVWTRPRFGVHDVAGLPTARWRSRRESGIAIVITMGSESGRPDGSGS